MFVSTYTHGHFGPVSSASALRLQSAPSIIIIIAFRRPSNYAVSLALTSTLSANYPFHTGFRMRSLCTSLCVPFPPSSLSIPPCLFLSFSSSFSLCVVGDGCFSWQMNRLGGGLVPVTLHIFPSFSLFLSSLPFSDDLFLAARPQQFIGVALPRRYTNCYSISPSLHHRI